MYEVFIWYKLSHCFRQRHEDRKTIWRYACCRCGQTGTSPWFESDPKPCCVRELNTGVVTDTLNTTKAKFLVEMCCNLPFWYTNIPTSSSSSCAFPDFPLYMFLSAFNIPPQLHLRKMSKEYRLQFNTVVSALEILRHCLLFVSVIQGNTQHTSPNIRQSSVQ